MILLKGCYRVKKFCKCRNVFRNVLRLWLVCAGRIFLGVWNEPKKAKINLMISGSYKRKGRVEGLNTRPPIKDSAFYPNSTQRVEDIFWRCF